MQLDEAAAARLAHAALGHVTRVYPSVVALSLTGPADLVPPDQATPLFRGSYDWHSCVHGYWTLTRLKRLFPSAPFARDIAVLLKREITRANAAAETQWLSLEKNRAWERPYGWAWLLMLVAELRVSPDTDVYAGRLQDAADVIVARLAAYLPRLTYPVRSGVHSNTAFAMLLTLTYARKHDAVLKALIIKSAKRWFGNDAACTAWGEPSGEDFLSAALTEAALMTHVLGRSAFNEWMARFMPRVPKHLFAPAHVSDRSDGRIAHLDGLNLSRAWAMRMIASRLDAPANAARFQKASGLHLAASLPHVTGDYMGEHWLASFALLALSDPRRARVTASPRCRPA